MRLIDADALNIRKYTRWFECPADERQVERMIREAPTIDAVPVVHGEWLISSDGYYPYCSRCNRRPHDGVMTQYCPECGALMGKVKMDGGSDNA